MKSCNAKETVKTTRVTWKTTTIGQIREKQQQLCTCSTLFCTFLCCCFAWLQHETSRNFLVKCFIKEILCVFFFSQKKVKRKTGLLCSFLCLSPGGHAIYRRNMQHAWNAKFHQHIWRGGRTYLGTILSEPKFLGCIDNQIFLPMVPL